jgi:hypothetical protein
MNPQRAGRSARCAHRESAFSSDTGRLDHEGGPSRERVAEAARPEHCQEAEQTRSTADMQMLVTYSRTTVGDGRATITSVTKIDGNQARMHPRGYKEARAADVRRCNHRQSRRIELHRQETSTDRILFTAVLRGGSGVDDAALNHDIDLVGDLFG